ncbi:MAG: mannose-1-phosphate guanylyltransferase/mannose-6-phosphate isomerase [Chlamydiae bacterium CG10_big_fil_rev_8_21_14_0_10_35_9]|nr:MAG: mannose-1-phosphate guanylyltransferase/mannose-6-phosphate isomerase [Chlamydiae bacterium CG10_big_fil_rev_8_21_14_0_10_35_9]
MKLIILAGGKGKRLWPFSKDTFPKQFLKFEEDGSLLQKTIQRFSSILSEKDIVISTNESYAILVKKQLGSLAPHIVVEPEGKNTAPAIALSVKYIQEKMNLEPNEPILVIPSDHFIEPEEVFLSYLFKVSNSPASKDCLITFGIKPTRPETGYGYIESGSKIDKSIYQVERFIEKPPLKAARKYICESNFYWNSGMFLFSLATFSKELEKYAPDIFQQFLSSFETMQSNFSNMPFISFDFALMEKTTRALVCPMDVSWSDVGSWDSVYDVMPKDLNQNVKIGNVVAIDTKNSLIIGNKKLVSTLGLKDIIFIETDDAIFLSKKGKSQEVKKLVNKLSNLDLSNVKLKF